MARSTDDAGNRFIPSMQSPQKIVSTYGLAGSRSGRRELVTPELPRLHCLSCPFKGAPDAPLVLFVFTSRPLSYRLQMLLHRPRGTVAAIDPRDPDECQAPCWLHSVESWCPSVGDRLKSCTLKRTVFAQRIAYPPRVRNPPAARPGGVPIVRHSAAGEGHLRPDGRRSASRHARSPRDAR